MAAARGARKHSRRNASEEEPQSVRALPSGALIAGLHRLPPTAGAARQHELAVRRAHAWIDSRQMGACSESTPKYFASFMTAGIGNDVNQVVRSLAIALYRGRQLVLLPPFGTHRRRLNRNVERRLDSEHPWHWMQDAPLTSLFRVSSCHRILASKRRLEALANFSRLGLANSTNTAIKLLGDASLENSSVSQSQTSWRVGLGYLYIPIEFRSMGMLWWFQILTTYFVRIHKPWRQRIIKSPAAQQLLAELPIHMRTSSRTYGHSGDDVSCSDLIGIHRCHGSDVLSHLYFDIGLHIRLGDACRPEHTRIKTRSRACFRNLTQAVQLVDEVRGHQKGGSMFLATDSDEIISQANLGAAAPYQVFHLNLSRKHYDTVLPNELRAANRKQDLVDMLLELIMLSNARLLAGTMHSNVPRLALQLRVHPPGTPFVSLDRREWCTRSSCRMNYTGKFATA